ncbi:chemotaxis protein CheD [Gemmatimonas aurantiaca]|uniref:chemotaxis protein CheD n=1 Tax=Gemmatimonas aurantiaca TaxID=173480 RepID=UPI00301C9D95
MSQIAVGIADFAVGAGDLTLITIGLGSCVAIALHDAECCIGGLAHILLPHPAHSAGPVPPGKVPSSAVPAMVARMRAMGSTGELRARLVGGASMFAPLLPSGAVGLGARNVQACRLACAAHEIPVTAEAVGGEVGRSVYFDVRTGRIQVRTVLSADVVL